MSILFKNKALSYIVRFFRRLIELITRFVLFLKYCGRAKKLADIEDPILLESACSLAEKIRRGEVHTNDKLKVEKINCRIS
ncbi:uncharacterized protein CEXT_258951 [Caerostris extrusa]|uniref:Uncharacterized protein n=1 Tax=Caerostris extrusa TaxID=172846 RepID=A0AAV4NZ46_CAEEX|nr:uncharacterized protein CEXT_258951 [Caerostris extrusa]